MKNKDDILNDFDNSKTTYNQFKNAVCQLITDLLVANNIKIHNISGRLKERTSLEKKIKSKQNKYSKLTEITDIAGIRIITFFEDEVDKIADIINKEFKIDPINSIDKRDKEFDRFGYLSLHFVVKLSESRLKLTEYKKYKNLKLEIQIRSILQHAWAEIEHDLGYKTKESIPNQVKRNFSRVAALLETADLEFSKLKDSIELYESTIDEKVKHHPESTDLNMASFNSFIHNNKTLLSVDKALSKATNCKLDMEFYDNGDTYLKEFKLLNISSIQQLEELLKKYKNDIIQFALAFVGEKEDDDDGMYIRGSSIFYLNYLLVLQKNNPELLEDFIKNYKGFYNTEDYRYNEFYESVMNSYEKTKN
ncbi:(p)ppGpp synthetase [Tenacibaculum ascidiaceicola]|uniref:GTP pyrophosphokinase n=1 Tax=Tenacibaculum ascidiaceicola TaxID=1699411 RepID=UPI0039EAA4BC